MYVTKHLDWLSITFQTGTDLQRIFPTLDWHYIGRGNFGYKFKYQDKITRAYYQEGSQNDDMGVHLTLSGDALNSLRSACGGDDDTIARTCADWHGYASRADLTINIHEGKMTPRTVYNAIQSGKAKARTKTYRYIEGKRGDVAGDTFYLGAPKSDRQFRCYNKAAELGIVDAAAWVRLELELRSVFANAAFQSCARNGTAETVSGHMADFLHWDAPEFNAAIAGPSVLPVDIPRKQTNRQRWLLGQVAQALAKEMREDVNFKPLFDLAVSESFDLLD